MGPHLKPTFVERLAEKLKIIPDLHRDQSDEHIGVQFQTAELKDYPTPDRWDDWSEYEATRWPRKQKKNYMLVPTTCFNCESGCGLLAYVDKQDLTIRKFEGNPYHPGSRGRNCAKGPATINQIEDTDRILYPMKRKGERGAGEWERISWDQALDEISARIRKALKEERRNEVVYHVGRPGHEGYMERVLKAWGVDGHNSHTNICSASARFGYVLWHGYDRPSADYANAEFMLMISAQLESGHYFNPHAQRIMEGMMKGAKLAVIDPRLSNTASMADYWMPAYPGSEAALLLAMAKVILDENLFNREFMETWVNWQEYMEKEEPNKESTFDNFIISLRELYKEYTPEFAEKESGVKQDMIIEIARKIGHAGTRFASHIWRASAMGNLGGWQSGRALHFLNVLVGSVGSEGGTSPSAWNKFKPAFFNNPPAHKFWNELHFPKEYPLSHYEMSFLLPHLLKDGRGKLDVYFTRVFNPVWTYPDGFTWIEALSDEKLIGMHIALTPTWNETAYFADYVLPMGHASERHDIVSYETHSGVWIAFRQPVLREALRKMGREVEFTYQANPGEVWEEDEFWIELSWRIDNDDSLGIRKHFISPYREGQKIKIDEYYRYIFENTKGLPEAASREGLTPLDYMKKYGAFEVEKSTYNKHTKEVDPDGVTVDEKTGLATKNGKAVGVKINGKIVEGFISPSRKQEIHSQMLVDWKWPEHRLPGYIKSHIHQDNIDFENGEFPLIPTFRLPNLIHTRSGNAKWLVEIAHKNPVWMHTSDAERLNLNTGDLIRVNTEIGFFVSRVWVTEALRPKVVVCSHHIGRWRRTTDAPGNRWATNLVDMKKENGKWTMRVLDGIRPYKSTDTDSSRIYWSDGGVHQNITQPVHPEPRSGAHCWHQKVRIEKAHEEDRYGDVSVDTNKSMEVFRKWLDMTRPAPGPDGLRRPLHLNRPLRPVDEAYYIK